MSEGHNWNEAVGMSYEALPKIIFPKDNEIISCLLTCEHLSLMCQKLDALSPKEMADKAQHWIPDLQRVPEEAPKLGSDIQVMPVQWNLTMVLSKSQPVELLCPMFIQNLNSDSSAYDKSNEDLYREILEKIAKLHDREVTLLETDHEEFTNYLAKCKDRKLKFPAKDPPLRSRMSLSRRLPTKSSIKWVCFIKGMGISKTLVTLLPKSYAELKSLLVEDSNLAGNNPMAVNIVQKPIVPLPKHQPILVPTPDDSQCSSELINSTNSSMSNLDMTESETRMKSGSISRQRKRSSITTPTPKDEFRKRVFSSDSVQASDRNRCRSFDTDGSVQVHGQVPTRNSGGPSAASRPRTQTHSQIQRLVSKQPKKPTACKKPSKKIWGSVTLPLFSFDVITTDVTAHLLHANHPKFAKHSWASVMVRNTNESKSESAKASEPSQPPQQPPKEPPKEPLAEVDKSHRLHCINLQMVYYRAFVFSTFKALLMHHPIHAYDVNTAIGKNF